MPDLPPNNRQGLPPVMGTPSTGALSDSGAAPRTPTAAAAADLAAAPAQQGPALPPPRSAYVHIPFCHRRCFYCDFPVVPLGDRADGSGGSGAASIAAYLLLLHREITTAPPGPPLSTVY
ncbi:MAG: hypothetical protein WCI65_14905, partial [Synechococcaceae cyanobacterium ELA263]